MNLAQQPAMTIFSSRNRNIVATALIAISLICLYPGLTKPMLQITAAAELPFVGRVEMFNQIQSVIESVEALYESKNRLVASLILLFSVIVPLIKASILLSALAFPRLTWRWHLFRFVELIGKWSMADVFVVAVFMAFLATEAHTAVTAILHPGFYYFTAYCLISLLSIQVMDIKRNNLNTEGGRASDV